MTRPKSPDGRSAQRARSLAKVMNDMGLDELRVTPTEVYLRRTGAPIAVSTKKKEEGAAADDGKPKRTLSERIAEDPEFEGWLTSGRMPPR